MNTASLPWTLLHGNIAWIPVGVVAILAGFAWGRRARSKNTDARVTPVVGAIAATVLCTATMWIAGAVASSYVKGPTFTEDGSLISGEPIPFAAQIASALPFHRDETLRRLSLRVEAMLPEHPELASTYVALEGTHGDRCHAFSILLREQATVPDAADLALACEDAHNIMQVAELSYRKGKFAEASTLVASLNAQPQFVDALLPTQIHLMAGESVHAAASARQSADLPDTNADQRISLRCVADYLDAQSGDEEAKRRLRESTQSSPDCLLLMADLADLEERTPLLGYLADRHPSPTDQRTAAAIRADAELNETNANALLSTLTRASVLAAPFEALNLPDSIAIESRLLTRLRAQTPTGALRELRIRLAMVLANFEISGGRLAEATELAELAVSDATARAADAEGSTQDAATEDAAVQGSDDPRAVLDFAIILRAAIASWSGETADAERLLGTLENPDRSAARRIQNVLGLERSPEPEAIRALDPAAQEAAILGVLRGNDPQPVLESRHNTPTLLLAVMTRTNPGSQEAIARSLADALPDHATAPAVTHTLLARPIAVSPDSDELLRLSASLRQGILRRETGLALGLLTPR